MKLSDFIEKPKKYHFSDEFYEFRKNLHKDEKEYEFEDIDNFRYRYFISRANRGIDNATSVVLVYKIAMVTNKTFFDNMAHTFEREEKCFPIFEKVCIEKRDLKNKKEILKDLGEPIGTNSCYVKAEFKRIAYKVNFYGTEVELYSFPFDREKVRFAGFFDGEKPFYGSNITYENGDMHESSDDIIFESSKKALNAILTYLVIYNLSKTKELREAKEKSIFYDYNKFARYKNIK